MRVHVLLGHLLFLGLLVLAMQHYLLRVVHVDTALQFFKWVQSPGLEVEAHRYTAIVPQLLVKLGKALGAGLDTLMQVASAAHVLVGWAVYALCAHCYRSAWTALACALATVLCTRLTFYGIALEANYLVAYPFLLLAAMDPTGQKAFGQRSYLLVALALLSLVVHPLGFLVVLYIGAFILLNAPAMRTSALAIMAMALIWGGLGRVLFPPSAYESDLYQAVREGLSAFAGDDPLPGWLFLTGHSWSLTTHYLPAWLLLGITLVLIGMRRAWWTMALVLAGTSGYVLLNVVTYHAGETAMMMEKNFVPLATLIAVPLVYEVLRLPVRAVQWSVLPFALVLFIKFRDISFASRPMQARYQAVAGLVEDAAGQGVRKGIVDGAGASPVHGHVSWALPFETLLLSARTGVGNACSLVPREATADGLGNGVFLMPWIRDLPVEALHERFFSLPEGPYAELANRVRE